MQTRPPSPIPPSPTTPLETATPEPTSTPNFLMATADMNARVRSGPDEVYEVLDFLLTGDSAEVIGRYENNGYTPTTWWYIRRIDTGKDGWVWSAVVTLSGDASGVPFLEPPPATLEEE
jgi:SH3-like domain-containing protein